MNKVDVNLVFRVMKNITKSLDETMDIMPSLLGKIIVNYQYSIQENNIAGVLVSLQLLQKHIKESANEETLKVITNKLIEHKVLPAEIKNYDLTSPTGFLQAMEDEIIREMVSGAAIGGPMSGLGTNAQTNSTGMSAPTGSEKKKSKKKIDAVLVSRYR